MIERIPDLVNADANLVRRGRWFSAGLSGEIGDPGLPSSDRREGGNIVASVAPDRS